MRDPAHLFGAYGVAVSGHYAYVAAQGLLAGQPTSPDTSTGAFDVIDVSNPASPTIVATMDNAMLPAPWTGTNALDHADSVSVAGHDVYITSSFSNRLTVVDVSNPLSPAIIASLRDGSAQAPAGTLRFPVDVVVQGTHAYVADQIATGRLTVVDVSTPANPQVVGSLANVALNGAYRLRSRGSHVFVTAAGASAVSEVDVSDPAAPLLVSSVTDTARLNHTTGLDLDPTGHYVIASSPALSSQPQQIYPPFPLTPGGPINTGTVSLINLDPVTVTIAPASRPANPTTSTTADFAFSTNDPTAALVCRLDARRFTACRSPATQSYRSLASGGHTFVALAIDPDGSVGAAAYAWTIVPPAIAHLRQAAKTWREGTAKPSRRGRHRARIGTVFTFTLSENAALSLSFTTRAQGRRLSGGCVAPSRRTMHKPRCTRTIVAGRSSATGHKGANRIVFKGRVKGRRTLSPGHYALLLIATGSGARISLPSSISFTIIAG